ncbi:thiamin pyrophosphokinase 1 isoform X2 [Harpegnathos saltator]|uniref:thiamin pyrophosphokinase 1 isoform X2 n=1 Tax=Harpegnathos saltator TaxID=610380 RepID=UPI000DBEDF97|nr:thiamin pyrophosphokinase 1 isoform X2 [Harpegnathos saltator]
MHHSISHIASMYLHASTHVPTSAISRQNFVVFNNEQRLRNILSSTCTSQRYFRITFLPQLHLDVSSNVRVHVPKHVVLANCTMQQQLQSEPKDMTVWNPFNIFHPEHCDYAVLVLNQPILLKPQQMLPIWEKDGGIHRWLEYLKEIEIDVLNNEYRKYVPDLITGDMDSCSETVVEKLRSMGSTVVRTPDQNYTDFTKALVQIEQYARLKNINLKEIYAFVETTGRFDHIIGNTNTLYKSEKLVGNIKVIQVAANSLTWILRCGLHKINIPEELVQCKSWCSLMPLGHPVKHISTTGLKWNLNNAPLIFGKKISTSNTYDSCEVMVDTDTPVTWSMGIEPLMEIVNNHRAS